MKVRVTRSSASTVHAELFPTVAKEDPLQPKYIAAELGYLEPCSAAPWQQKSRISPKRVQLGEATHIPCLRTQFSQLCCWLPAQRVYGQRFTLGSLSCTKQAKQAVECVSKKLAVKRCAFPVHMPFFLVAPKQHIDAARAAVCGKRCAESENNAPKRLLREPLGELCA